MFRAQIIGNLGADARLESNNGRPFVSFNVAHNDSYTKEDGTKVEKMQWVSCAMNGDGGNLLQYLKKGKQVFIEGRCSTRVYSSEKERRMVAGVNVSVDHLELLGGSTDEVPSRLFDNEGVMHNVNKSYWIDSNEAKVILGKSEMTIMQNMSGQHFVLRAPCWVTPATNENAADAAMDTAQVQSVSNETNNQVEIFDGNEGDVDSQATELQAKMRNKKGKSK